MVLQSTLVHTVNRPSLFHWVISMRVDDIVGSSTSKLRHITRREYWFRIVGGVFAEIYHSQSDWHCWEPRLLHTKLPLTFVWSLHASIPEMLFQHCDSRKHHRWYHLFRIKNQAMTFTFLRCLLESPITSNSSDHFGCHKWIFAGTSAIVLNDGTFVFSNPSIILFYHFEVLW